jgi:uncharacterized protein YxeA
MKKIVIIVVAILLTTGVTTFALTNKEAKTDQIKVENTNAKVTTQSANAVLATAD